MLEVLREYQLFVKLNKSLFYHRKIYHLKYIISKEGIAVYPKNIEDIKEWPIPKNVINARSFIGLVGYYKRFIYGFSKTAHPITTL